MIKALEHCVVSISGIRGIVGQAMNPGLMCLLGAAVGSRLAKGKTVVLGRDSRGSGELLAQAVASGLRGVGCTVIDLGIVPTPTVPLMIKKFKAGAGLQISASHNPEPWNALKIYTRRGRNVDAKELAQVLTRAEQIDAQATDSWQAWSALGESIAYDQSLDDHIAAISKAVDLKIIQDRRFTVVMDSVNGAGATIAPKLLEALGCRVIPIYDRSDRLFPRDPEPNATNVVETGKVVKALGADLGFVQDPDADRLAVIDAKGRFIGEEYTLVLCAAARFAAAKQRTQGKSKATKPVAVTNLSTSRMLEDVAKAHGARVVRTAVGEANILDAMQAEDALIGGEGNGGVIDPRVVWCRDSQVGMALILEYLGRTQQSLEQAVAQIPTYAMHKEKIAFSRQEVTAAMADLRTSAYAEGAQIDEQDGIKFIWSDRWVHLRASGTEPVSRIISEAPNRKQAVSLATSLRKILGAKVVTGH